MTVREKMQSLVKPSKPEVIFIHEQDYWRVNVEALGSHFTISELIEKSMQQQLKFKPHEK